jgi:ribosomal protein L40E
LVVCSACVKRGDFTEIPGIFTRQQRINAGRCTRMVRAGILHELKSVKLGANMSDLINPRHNEIRSTLRTVGPAVAITGLIFTIIGVGSFFAAFGGFGPPRFFWCAFLGLPLLAIGIGISQFAYIGAITRYVAGEGAPVAKDMTNYMVEGTRDSIRDVATALGEGFAAAKAPSFMTCQRCGANNNSDASFCRACGGPVATTKTCAKCGEANDVDARFCDHCGTAVV